MIHDTEWLNANSHRDYPLYRINDWGHAKILPTDAILDFKLTLYSDEYTGLDSDTLMLSSIQHFGSGFIVIFAFEFGIQYTVTIPANAQFPYIGRHYRADMLTGAPVYDLTCVFGPGILDVSSSMGTYYTSYAVEPTLISVQTRHRVMSFVGDTPLSVPVSGDVYIEDGYGVYTTIDPVTNTVRVNAKPGAGLGYPCKQQREEFEQLSGLAMDTLSPKLTISISTQPSDVIIVDSMTFGFDAAHESAYDVYVPLGADITETATNLYQALQQAIVAKDITLDVSDASNGIIMITAYNNAFLHNTSSTEFTLTKDMAVTVDCDGTIVYINDVSPNGAGDMLLTAGRGFEVVNMPDAHTIKLNNTMDIDSISCGKCTHSSAGAGD